MSYEIFYEEYVVNAIYKYVCVCWVVFKCDETGMSSVRRMFEYPGSLLDIWMFLGLYTRVKELLV